MTKKQKIILYSSIAALLAGVAMWYFVLRDKGNGKNGKNGKNGGNGGNGIPSGWSPTPSAIKLYKAMKGWGTDEQAIWDTLDNTTNAQRIAIYNEFQKLYGEDLLDWFSSDLNWIELVKARNYFKGLL